MTSELLSFSLLAFTSVFFIVMNTELPRPDGALLRPSAAVLVAAALNP